jgi:hypothetical protein
VRRRNACTAGRWAGALAAAVLAALAPTPAQACACGCGIFTVGTPSLFPLGPGGLVYMQFDEMAQDENWSGGSRAPAAANPDKRITTRFFTAGLHYMFDRRWGVQVAVPFWDRAFTTTTDGGGTATFRHSAVGDVRVMAVYSGFSADMSTGVLAGVKLPTGDSTYAGFDRDTEIGTGSTDVLLGVYHMGRLSADGRWSWFGQADWDHPFATRGGYRPGEEVNAALGVYVDAGALGRGARIAPLLRLVGSHRERDRGPAADPENTGYTRVLLSPGVEFDLARVKLVADVGVPVSQRVNGNQLVAPRQFTLTISFGL